MDWNEFYFRHVYLVASKSKDSRTKIGSIIVRGDTIISEGYNGICRGLADDFEPWHERPIKYHLYEHSERNSVYNCARNGISTLGARLYTQGIPCSDCARACIQAGLIEINIHKQWPDLGHSEKWIESIKYSKVMFHEIGIKIKIYDKILNLEGLLDGKIIKV